MKCFSLKLFRILSERIFPLRRLQFSCFQEEMKAIKWNRFSKLRRLPEQCTSCTLVQVTPQDSEVSGRNPYMALEVPRQSESAGVVAMQTRAQPPRNETRHTFSAFFFQGHTHLCKQSFTDSPTCIIWGSTGEISLDTATITWNQFSRCYRTLLTLFIVLGGSLIFNGNEFLFETCMVFPLVGAYLIAGVTTVDRIRSLTVKYVHSSTFGFNLFLWR